MYDTPLKYVSEHKYLGVWIDEKLSWHSRVTKTCNKANKMVGFLQRNLKTCPVHLKVQAYKQLVLPILECSAPIWDPHNQTDIQKVEMVQRQVARFVLNISIDIVIHQVQPTGLLSDHFIITFNLSAPQHVKVQNSSGSFLNYSRANWDE